MVFASILIAAAICASGAAPSPDTTKATVIDDLSVLGMRGQWNGAEMCRRRDGVKISSSIALVRTSTM